MTWIKRLACYYGQNFRPVSRRFQSHEIRVPRFYSIPAVHGAPAPTPKMEIKNTRVVAVSPLPPPPPPPPKFPFFTWAKWVLGSIVTIMLPIWNKQWRSLLKIEGEVEMVAEVVENAAEVVEEVATVTEKMAADAAESLPENGKLRGAALFVERVSKEAAHEAHLTHDIIHKVEELKEEMEKLIEPEKEREKQHVHRHGN